MAAEKAGLTGTVIALLGEKKFQSVRDILLTMQPVDIAAVLAELSAQDILVLIRLLPKDAAAETFVEMTAEQQEELIHSFSDSEQRLGGIVTVDDVMDVIRDEATEDIDKMAAVTPADKPYLKLSVFDIFKSRIPWLMLLMISATFTGSIITHFQDALSAHLVLVAAIPMLMDTGGNCGSQASVTIIRGISLQEIKFSDIFRVMWKEARVSLLCGVTLAVLNFLKLIFLNRVGVMVAAVICTSLMITVLAAKLVGCSLPLLAKRLGLDPAVMASPFITTIVDALSLFIYFKIAGAILGV